MSYDQSQYGQQGGPPAPPGYYPGYQPPPPGQAAQPHNPGQYQPNQQQPGQPQQGQYPPPGQPPQGQYSQPPQGQYAPPGQPPQGQYGQPPQGQYPPPGAPPQNYQGQAPQQYPPQQYPNQPPQQGYQGQPQQPYPNQPPPQNYQAPPPQGYQGQPPQGYQGGPPQGYPGQPSPQPYAQQPVGMPPGQAPPGQYYNPNQPPYQGGAGGPPPHHVWQQPPQADQPLPPSLGYDPSQKAHVGPIDTRTDTKTLHKAMKGMGCDERALIKVFTSPQYSSPWAMKKLAEDYKDLLGSDLVKDIKSETRGSFEDALVALIRGPLEVDAKTLDSAMDRAGTDETALADVLLCRSNADIRAITQKYTEITGKNLAKEIKSEVGDTLQRLYSMILSAQKKELSPYAQVDPREVEKHVIELHQATEGVIGSNAISVAQIFATSSDKHIAALNTEYQRKYHRSLEDVIEKEFRGDTEDALLQMLKMGTNRAKADAEWLRQPLTRGVGVKDKHFIYRLTTLYWNKTRLEEAKQAYEQRYRKKLVSDVKEMLSGDYEDLMVALLGGKK